MSHDYVPFIWLYQNHMARFGDIELILVAAHTQDEAFDRAASFLDRTPYQLPKGSTEDFKVLGTANLHNPPMEPGVITYSASGE